MKAVGASEKFQKVKMGWVGTFVKFQKKAFPLGLALNKFNEVPERIDNPDLAVIVRNPLAEFGAANPGTVFFDPTTDALFELFQTPKSVYFVAEKDGKILGGGGIFPTEGLHEGTCELVKMYLLPEARGIGLGHTLIKKCLETAMKIGFQQV